MPVDKMDLKKFLQEVTGKKNAYTEAYKNADMSLLEKYAPNAYKEFMSGLAKEAMLGVAFGAIPQLQYDDSEALRDLKDLKKNAVSLSTELSKTMAHKGASYMRKLTKVDIEVKDGEILAESPQWIFLNYGTRPHKIRPKNAKVLRFFPAGASVAVYSTYVNHPGTKKQGFVQATTAYITREINDYDFK